MGVFAPQVCMRMYLGTLGVIALGVSGLNININMLNDKSRITNKIVKPQASGQVFATLC